MKKDNITYFSPNVPKTKGKGGHLQAFLQRVGVFFMLSLIEINLVCQ